MALIHDFLANFDIFAFPVFLNMNRKSSYKSWIGGIGTIFMIVAFVLFFSQRFIQFVLQEKVYINEEEEYNTSPGVVELKQDSFMFAVNIQGQNFKEPVEFDIELEQRHKSAGVDVTGSKYAEHLKLELCTESHFEQVQGLPKETIDHAFQNEHFDHWLCPRKEDTLWLGGVYTSDDFLYLQFKVRKCQPGTTTNDFTIQCTSGNIVRDEQYKFMFYHTNFLVNKNSDEVPVNTYINDFLYFNFKPGLVHPQGDIFLREYFIKTDPGIWGFAPAKELKFPLYQQGDSSEYYEPIDQAKTDDYLDGTIQDASFIEINIRRSPFSHKVERFYEQIDEFLAYLGGFVATLIGIFGGGLSFFKKQEYQIELANQIYQFKREENMKQMQETANQKSQHKHGQKCEHTRSEYLQKQFEEYYNIRKPLRMTCKYYVAMIFCKKICYGEEEKLIDAAIQRTNEIIDIKEIMILAEQNKKSSLVTLGKKQRDLLQLIPKQDVSSQDYKESPGFCDDLKAMKGKNAKQILYMDKDFQEQFSAQNINELYQAYESAMDNNQDKECLKQNRRILKQIKKLDPQLISIFEEASNMEFKAEKDKNLTKKQKKQRGISLEPEKKYQTLEIDENKKKGKENDGENKSRCTIF